jgi:PEP-CTERM motif
MSKLLSTAIVAVTVALASTPAAAVTTLTFSNACGGICAPYDTISQSYGDIAGVLDISYRSVVSNGSTVTAGAAYFWSTGYGDLSDVIWGAQGGTLEIAFTLLAPNKQIVFNSVDYATYGGLAVQTQLALFSSANAGNLYLPLIPSSALTAQGAGHATWAPNLSSANGFILHFGSDAFNAAIDNLTFTISNVNVSSPVPEPATWLSMILGFGLVGAAARRRAARSAVAIV